MNKVVAFDMDGTLVNSVKHLLPAYRESLAEIHHAPVPYEKMLQCIGGTMEDNRQLIMPESTIEEFYQYEMLVAKNATKYAKTHGECYPHIPESLKMLRQSGYITVLCSNGTREYVLPLLETLQLTKYLDHVQEITVEKNKTHLLASIVRDFDCAENIVLVGDRHFDAEAARNNGVPFIGCKYGLFPKEIDAARPEAILNDPLELLDAVKRLLGPATLKEL